MKKDIETPLPCIQKGNRWYNTLTKKYVSKTYAKRLNAYTLQHPDHTLFEARGHGVYVPERRKKTLTEHSEEMREMFFEKGKTQIVKTITLKGKKVHFAPIHDEIVDDDILKHLKKLDYKKKISDLYLKMNVELYRLTRLRRNIYHIFTVNVQQRLVSPSMVDMWEQNATIIFESLMKEVAKVWKNHYLGDATSVYFTVSDYVYSDLDGWKTGIASKFVILNRTGVKIMADKFKDHLDWYRNKLEGDTYHNIMVQEIAFYIMGWYGSASPLQQQIARLRIGVTHLPYEETPKEKLAKEKAKFLRKKRVF